MKRTKQIFTFLFLILLGLGLSQIDWGRSPPQGCAFCNAEILEKQVVYRGKVASLVFTYKPVVEGHLLAIPNRHVEDFDGLNQEELDEIAFLIRKAHGVFKTLYGASDYLLLQKNGKLAGLEVPHVHFHIFPRTEKIGTLGFVIRVPLRGLLKPLASEEMEKRIEEMRVALKQYQS